ncbi:MAG TPA: PAS domain S-box protein, partial [Geobacteraceae bacterium]
MKPRNKYMLPGLINAAIALILFFLCLEIPFLNDHPQNGPILQVIHGLLVSSLIAALVMLQFSTGRKRRQEEADNSREAGEILRAAEKKALRYKNLLECANDAIFVIDAGTGRLVVMNSKGGELFGYSREELERLHGRDLVPLRDQPLYGALVRRLTRRGTVDGTCITFKRKDGSRFLGEVSARLIEWEDGKVAQAIVRDITLKRQEEEEIRRRNRKLAILNSIIARVNQSIHLHKVLDLTLQETMDLFGAEGGTIHLQEGKSFVLVAQKNLPSQFIAMMCKDDPGVGHPCLMAASRQCTTLQGKGAGCSVAQTARNSGWQSTAGIPLFAGKRLVGIMHVLSRCEREFVPDDISFFTTMGNQLGIGIEHARMFEELNWKSEELLRSHRLLEKNSLQLKISRNKLEKNLALVERANMELERLDMMKNHFIGMVSHEFRTPLTSILSGTEFLLTRYGERGDDSLHRLLEMIHKSG